LNSLNDGDIGYGLRARSDGLRENAVKLAERRITSADVRQDLLDLVADSRPGVRLQLAFIYGEIPGPEALDALEQIARRDGRDPWIRAAILSSVGATSDQLLVRLFSDQNGYSAELVRELGKIVGARGQLPELQRVITAAQPSLRDVATGIGEGLKRSGKTLRDIEWDTQNYRTIEALLSQAAETAAHPQESNELRIDAIRLLALDEFDRVKQRLAALMDARQPREIQLATVAAIGNFNHAETAPLVLSRGGAAAPAVRSEIISALLNGRNRLVPLLQAIDDGRIPANQFHSRGGLRCCEAAIRK
jgi:hypothetical protein